MASRRDKIIRAVEAKGYSVVHLSWEPIGQMVEMQGREGGWELEIEPPHEWGSYCTAFNADDLLEQIARLPDVRPEGGERG